ncbi:unnamed protein product [Staurois parvus]|uniref:Uncharacterized protein n=1 Tax=Staurois parvus TaxID=386267 RepID=A0ABN9CYS2_9NEOB|nr:unnamed protein product [Staurois parvus]
MPVIGISLLTSCHADNLGDISATCQCPSVPALSAHPCHLPVPISATFQCPSVPHSAHLSCLSVSPHQCQSVSPINASQCHLSVLPISAT